VSPYKFSIFQAGLRVSMEEDGLYTDEVCGVYDSEAVPAHAEAGAGHPSSLMI